jgi:nucleoid-associated protein YgaU
MGSVAEAVLEFDEAVQVPWRPPLVGAARPADPSAGLHVFATPTSRRPRAARASRLTVPPPPALTEERPRQLRRSPGGATAAGHRCARCAGEERSDPPVRLTRRARRLVAAAVAGVAILLGIWVGSIADGGDEGLVMVSDSSVVVRSGDTLWSIAGSVAGEQDVRAVVDAILELNDLSDVTLQPGQVLRLP